VGDPLGAASPGLSRPARAGRGSATHVAEGLHVSSHGLFAGDSRDRLLFEGGKAFAGTVVLDKKDSGSPDKRVESSSYGEGRATLNGGNGGGLVANQIEDNGGRDFWANEVPEKGKPSIGACCKP